jgi:hypothetical protein
MKKEVVVSTVIQYKQRSNHEHQPRWVAYPLSADNVSRPLPIRLKGVNQSGIRT